jgi:hypothetical protein
MKQYPLAPTHGEQLSSPELGSALAPREVGPILRFVPSRPDVDRMRYEAVVRRTPRLADSVQPWLAMPCARRSEP